MKQLTNFTLAGLLSLQEFNDDYVINGLTYKKINLAPQGFNFNKTYCDASAKQIMLTDKVMTTAQTENQIFNRVEVGNNILQDNVNPNIF
jgi:hypothetical protein